LALSRPSQKLSRFLRAPPQSPHPTGAR
jgi:hypothetical protein